LRFLACLLVLAGAGLSSGCETMPWAPAVPPGASGSPGAETASTPPLEAPTAEAPTAEQAPAGTTPIATPPEAAPPKPEPPADEPTDSGFDPETLIGADRATAHAILGAPDSVVEQSSSTVWTYGDATCGLDVFFFLDVNEDELRVLTYELKLADESESGRSRCLNRLTHEDGA